MNLSLTGSLDWALLLDLSYFSIIDPRAEIADPNKKFVSARLSPAAILILSIQCARRSIEEPVKLFVRVRNFPASILED